MSEDWKFEPSKPGCGLKEFITEAVGAASVCWENFGTATDVPVNSGQFMSERASAIVDAIYERAMSPDGARLGMATTHQLLHEVAARLSDNREALHVLQALRAFLSNEEFAYRTVSINE